MDNRKSFNNSGKENNNQVIMKYLSKELSEKLYKAGLEVEPEYEQDGIVMISFYEILIVHCKAVFGESEPVCTNEKEPWKGQVCLHCGIDPAIQPHKESGCDHVHYPDNCDVCSKKTESYIDHTEEILKLLQKNETEKAELYIEKTCILFK